MLGSIPRISVIKYFSGSLWERYASRTSVGDQSHSPFVNTTLNHHAQGSICGMLLPKYDLCFFLRVSKLVEHLHASMCD